MIPEIFSHRSIRSYLPEPVPEEVLRRILEAGVRASTTGNMQLYSLVVTTLPEIKERLAPCHFNQPMVTQAPVVITFAPTSAGSRSGAGNGEPSRNTTISSGSSTA